MSLGGNTSITSTYEIYQLAFCFDDTSPLLSTEAHKQHSQPLSGSERSVNTGATGEHHRMALQGHLGWKSETYCLHSLEV